MKKGIRTCIKYSVLLIMISLIAVGVIFIMGQFVELHPDAYRDGVMSVVYVFVLIIIIQLLIVAIKNVNIPVVRTTIDKLKTWVKSLGIIDNIVVSFTVITVLNSIMMVTGIDTPKTGTFTYIHLLVRLSIIILIVSVWMFKDLYLVFKTWSQKSTTNGNQNSVIIKPLLIKDNPSVLLFSASLYTAITAFICVMMIAFSPFISPQGGVNVYRYLLVLYGILVIGTMTIKKRVKPYPSVKP